METNIVTTLIAPLILALIMIGMGMSLTMEDFRRVVVYPKAVAIGVIGQILFLPLVGFAMAGLFPLTPELAVGVIILAACPGGVASNLVAHLSKGDTALSVTLTVISSFLAPITVPLIISLGLKVFMGAEGVELPILSTSFQVFLITVPTILAGMFIRAKAPGFADKMERFVKSFALLFLVLLIIGVAVKERANLPGFLKMAGPVCLSLCFCTGGAGFIAGRLFSLNLRQSVSICVEVGFQNSTLALVIASSFLQNAQMAVSPAIYTVIMYILSGILIFYMSFRKADPVLETESA